MNCSRRNFVKIFSLGIMALILSPVRSLFPSVAGKWIDVGFVDDFAHNTPTLIKEATLVATNLPIYNLQLFIIRKGNAIGAMSAKCTHRGCTVLRSRKDTISCPCHGAEFTLEGKVKKGPATGHLSWYTLVITESNRIHIDLNTTVPTGTMYNSS